MYTVNTDVNKMVKVYREYPVWTFYWWRFSSKYNGNLREFRKTIVSYESVACQVSSNFSKPLMEVGKIIDKYKTW